MNLMYSFFFYHAETVKWLECLSCSSVWLTASWWQPWAPPASLVLCAETSLQPVPTDWSNPSTFLAGQKQGTLVTFLVLTEYHRILHYTEFAIYQFNKRHFLYLGCQFTKFERLYIWSEWKLATRSLSLKTISLHQWEEYEFPPIIFQDELLLSLKS